MKNLNKFNKIFRKTMKTRNKKLFKNELPSPFKGYTPMLYFDFSTNYKDVCENILTINIKNTAKNCYNYLSNHSNLLDWNPCIYQIIQEENQKKLILHCFLKLGFLPIIELIIPLMLVHSENHKFLEFQNSSPYGTPMCGRIFIKKKFRDSTAITIYLRYALPLYMKDININAYTLSIIIDEILKKNLNLLKKKLNSTKTL